MALIVDYVISLVQLPITGSNKTVEELEKHGLSANGASAQVVLTQWLQNDVLRPPVSMAKLAQGFVFLQDCVFCMETGRFFFSRDDPGFPKDAISLAGTYGSRLPTLPYPTYPYTIPYHHHSPRLPAWLPWLASTLT